MTRTVTVGPGELLDVDELLGRRPRWAGPVPDGTLACSAQVRAHGEALPAHARVEGDAVRVTLHRPARGVAPGQAVVLYDGTRVLGSATVERARRGAARPPADGVAWSG